VTVEVGAKKRPIRTFLRKQWFGVFSLLVGVFLAAYFYGKSVSIRSPVFVTASNRVRLLDSSTIALAPIRALRPDGSVITRDLSVATIYFWNAGALPIRADDILEPLHIEVADTSVRILEAHLTGLTRPVTHISFVLDSLDRRSIALGFRIMETNDGFAAQIIYEGNPSTSFVLSGTIEGVPSIMSPARVSRFSLFVHKGSLMAIVTIAAVLVVASVMSLVNLAYWVAKRRGVEQQFNLGVGVVLGLVVIGFFVYAIGSAMIGLSRDPDLSGRSAQLLQDVPPSLLIGR
jgi:hypothetical protein